MKHLIAHEARVHSASVITIRWRILKHVIQPDRIGGPTCFSDNDPVADFETAFIQLVSGMGSRFSDNDPVADFETSPTSRLMLRLARFSDNDPVADFETKTNVPHAHHACFSDNDPVADFETSMGCCSGR